MSLVCNVDVTNGRHRKLKNRYIVACSWREVATAANRNDIMSWIRCSMVNHHHQGQQHTSICTVPSTWLSPDTLEALASTSNVSSQVRALLHEVATF